MECAQWTPYAVFRVPSAICVLVVLFLYMSIDGRLFIAGPPILAPQGSSLSASDGTTLVHEDVQALIDGLRKATARAASDARNSRGGLTSWSEQQTSDWKQRHSCQSRDELQPLYDRRQFVNAFGAPSSGWKQVLQEYENLHRTCTQGVGNLTDYFLSRNTTMSSCKFLVADAMDLGLGNRLLTVASAVMYAILTHRVLLVPASTRLPELLCEPFAGSSWRIDSNGVFTPAGWYPQMWTTTNAFFAQIDAAKAGNATASGDSITVYAARGEDDHWHPVDRFYCDAEQGYFANVTWVYLTGCHYFLPNLFTVPGFRLALEALIPDHKMSLTSLLRSIMLPGDSVWRRIKEANALYFDQNLTDRRVGIQVRYIYGEAQYAKYNGLVNNRTLSCLTENHILPRADSISADESKTAESSNSSSRNASSRLDVPAGGSNNSSQGTTVFIASLYDDLLKHLQKTYNESSTKTPAPPQIGSDADAPGNVSASRVIKLVQLTHGGEQRYGLQEDESALVEMLLLSFSDNLLVTPASTFAGIAQAYGGLIPWYIDYDPASKSAAGCFRGQTVDMCFSRSMDMFTCRYDRTDPAVNGVRRLTDAVPYIKECPAIETPHPPGFQIVT